jgi:nucleotide-binding universal stress UspA family protein
VNGFHNILVPVDFEPSSRRALDVATDFALRFDAKLTILHVWDAPSFPYASEVSIPDDLTADILRAARDRLDETVAGVRKRLPKAEAVLVRGRAEDEILATATRQKADLIVIGTHGRHGLNRLFLGSVAERVVRGSNVPVLTVRADGATT